MARYPQVRRARPRYAPYSLGSRSVPSKKKVMPRRRNARTYRRNRYSKRAYSIRRSPLPSAVCHLRSIPQDLWIGNPTTTDVVGASIYPYINTSTSTIDSYVYLNDDWVVNTNVNIASNSEFDAMKSYFRYCKVTSIWFKYTPGITEGNLVADASNYTGGVIGKMTYCVGRDPDFKTRYPLTYQGLQSINSLRNSRSVSMFKPFFKRWRPSNYIKYQAGTQEYKTIDRRVGCEILTDSPSLNSNYMFICMEVPKVCGKEQVSTSPFDGTNWPTEGSVAIAGTIEMGATVTFYGAKFT